MNTEHYTKEEAVELARECGASEVPATTVPALVFTHEELHALINTAVTRKLAEKELEVVRLREERVRELEESNEFLKEAIDAAVKDRDHYRNESQSRLEGLQGCTEQKRMLIDKITSLEGAATRKDAGYQAGAGETTDTLNTLTAKLTAAEERVKELEKPEKTCKWTDTGAIYNTECGHRWMFEAGDIADNGVKFCPYCGRKIDAAIERSE